MSIKQAIRRVLRDAEYPVLHYSQHIVPEVQNRWPGLLGGETPAGTVNALLWELVDEGVVESEGFRTGRFYLAERKGELPQKMLVV